MNSWIIVLENIFEIYFSALSQTQRRLSQRLVDFKFECIGNRQTDDEIIIASSLKEFGKLIGAIEDERGRMVIKSLSHFICAKWVSFRF